MPIYPFERTVFPSRHPSPFIGRVGGNGSAITKGPGGIIVVDAVDRQEDNNQGENVADGRRRSKRNGGTDLVQRGHAGGIGAQGSNAAAASSQFQYQPSNLSQQFQPPHLQQPNAPDRTVITAAGGLSALGQNAHIEKLPAETGMPYFFLLTEFFNIG